MDKKGFIAALNDALIVHGDGRYDYLRESPITYVETDWGDEIVAQGDKQARVTWDSLMQMLVDMAKQGVFDA